MSFFQTTLQRVQTALPFSWQSRLAHLIPKNHVEASRDAPRPSTPSFSTPYFPAIDWSDTDRMMDDNDPLEVMDRVLQGSTFYKVSWVSNGDGLYGAHNAPQACLDQCLKPKSGAGGGPSPT